MYKIYLLAFSQMFSRRQRREKEEDGSRRGRELRRIAAAERYAGNCDQHTHIFVVVLLLLLMSENLLLGNFFRSHFCGEFTLLVFCND